MFISGSLAGLLAQIISYPFDILKKRLHANLELNYRIINEIKIIHNYGIRGYYKAISLNLIKGPLSNGIAFLSKYNIDKLLKKYDTN